MSKTIPENLVNVLAEMVFSALIERLDPEGAELLVLYSWLACAGQRVTVDNESLLEIIASIDLW